MTDLLSRKFAPSPDAMSSRVGEETVILHLGSGVYYGLDDVGTRIWDLAGQGLSLPEIRDAIAGAYGVDPAQVEADLRRFVEDLLRYDMLIDV